MGFDKEKLWGWEEFLAAQGLSLALARYLSINMRERGGNIQDLRRLLAPPYLADKRFDSIAENKSAENHGEVAQPHLTLVGTIVNRYSCSNFVVKDYFKVDMSEGAEVPISYMSGFDEFCFDSLVEDGSKEMYISCNRVDGGVLNKVLFDHLSGRSRTGAVLTCEVLWKMLKAQAKMGYRENGIFLTDQEPSVFYIKNSVGVIFSFWVVWDGDGWQITVSCVDGPYSYVNPGQLVFSQNLSSLYFLTD